jgi:hypothetical protein
MPNQPYYFPKLPETYTVSYFNETEWNKGLTSEEIAKRDEIVDYQNQLLVGEKSYGPCSSCSGSNGNLAFELEIILKSSRGGWNKKTIYNVSNAREEASKIIREIEFWSDSGKFTEGERRNLVSKINSAIDEHINNNKNVNKTIVNDVESKKNTSGDCSVIM